MLKKTSFNHFSRLFITMRLVFKSHYSEKINSALCLFLLHVKTNITTWLKLERLLSFKGELTNSFSFK